MALADEYGSTSGNATRGRALKRMKLSFRNTEVQFAINPEDYTQTVPNRVTVTQTKGGAWLDAWGAGVVEITIKGTTGVRGTGTDIDEGYRRWRQLRALFTECLNAITNGEEVKDLIALYNFTDNEYWYCYPSQGGIELYRSKSRPHMYQYTVHLLGIREIGQPETSTGVIGNPNQATASGGAGINSQQPGEGAVEYGQGDETYKMFGTKTRYKSLMSIQTDCRRCCEKVAEIIGGSNGRIVPATGYQCALGLSIQSSGIVSNVPGFIGNDLARTDIERDNVLIAEAKFTPRVNVGTYVMYENIKNYSPTVLDPNYSFIVGETPRQQVLHAISQNAVFNSTLYNIIRDYAPKSYINKSEVLKLKLVLLDCMCVYLEAYAMKDQEETISTNLTMTSVNTLINNLSALILYFTLTPTNFELERMDITHELRELQKALIQFATNVISFL